MHFFKSFSLLHSRSKSDSALASGPSNTHLRTQSLSLPGQTNIFNTYIPVANLTASANPIQVIPPFHADRLNVLELEKAQLNCAVEVLLIRTSELRGELTNACNDLHDSLTREAYLSRQAKADEDEIVRLEDKVARYAKFVDLMVDIGLHEAVLARACGALRAGEDADEALIDSIKEAAAKPGSPWSKIIPAVTGPRSSEEYIAAINGTLKARKELGNFKKVVKFWKRVAKENSEVHADTITPALSTISSVHEVLSEGRQAAVVDLLAKRKSGPYFFRCTSALDNNESRPEVTTRCSNSPFMDAVFDEIDPTTIMRTLSATSASSSSTVSEHSSTFEDSPLTIDDSNDIGCDPSIPSLVPLASELFRKELVTSPSYKGVSKQIPASSIEPNSRIVLGELDLNRPTNRSSLPSPNPVAKQGSKLSAKALGKRTAMVVMQNIHSVEALYSFTPNDAPIPKACTAAIPTADSFIETLSASLLIVQAEHQRKSDGDGIYTASASFQNPISSSVTVESVSSSSNPARFSSGTLDSIQGTCQNDDISRTSSDSLATFSLGSVNGADTSGNLEHDFDGEIGCIVLPELMAEFMAGSTTMKMTPAEGSPCTPVKKSRLPKLKRHPFSTSPKCTPVSDRVFTRTEPLVIKKKTKVAVADVGVCSPAKQSPVARWTPSRLPTLSKLLPIGLRSQTRWLFDK